LANSAVVLNLAVEEIQVLDRQDVYSQEVKIWRALDVLRLMLHELNPLQAIGHGQKNQNPDWEQ
jgi:hypothetical protein